MTRGLHGFYIEVMALCLCETMVKELFKLINPTQRYDPLYFRSNTNDSGLSCHLAWQGFHEIWMPDTWQGTGLPNRSDPG